VWPEGTNQWRNRIHGKAPWDTQGCKAAEGGDGPGREWASAAAWADWAKNKGEFKIRFDFQISMDFWNLARL
jgi:hypothetical protein